MTDRDDFRGGQPRTPDGPTFSNPPAPPVARNAERRINVGPTTVDGTLDVLRKRAVALRQRVAEHAAEVAELQRIERMLAAAEDVPAAGGK